MLSFNQIISNSFKSTRTHLFWWIFAFLQIISVATISALLKPDLIFSPKLLLILGAEIILIPATVWLWMDIEADLLKSQTLVLAWSFIRICLQCAGLTLFLLALLLFARWSYSDWVFTSVFSSFAVATGVIVALYVVLSHQSLSSAWVLALDTWHKKISLVVAIACLLIVFHTVAFTLSHAVFKRIIGQGEFSAWPHSATIWLLLILVTVLIVFLAAWLNVFLVTLFLEIIRRKKDSEAVKEPVVNLTSVKAI